jgi:hypothetical protein
MSPQPKDGAPGTTDQSPRWEGPEENRSRGSLPALDDPAADRDAASENLADPDKSGLSDALSTGDDRQARIRRRAHEIWEREGSPEGHHERYWRKAVREIDEEDGRSP